jgi:hypothetical protein
MFRVALKVTDGSDRLCRFSGMDEKFLSTRENPRSTGSKPDWGERTEKFAFCKLQQRHSCDCPGAGRDEGWNQRRLSQEEARRTTHRIGQVSRFPSLLYTSSVFHPASMRLAS